MKRTNPLKFLYWPFLSMRAQWLSQLIAPHLEHQTKILDIGTGNMLLGKKLSQDSKVEFCGIDVLDMNLTNLPHTIFDGKRIPFPDKSFDTALFVGVLHHIDDQEAILREAMRVTRNTIIIFEDTYFSETEKLWVKLRDILGNLPEELTMHFALNFRNEIEWEQFFIKFGLKKKYKKTIFNLVRLTHHTLYVLEV